MTKANQYTALVSKSLDHHLFDGSEKDRMNQPGCCAQESLICYKNWTNQSGYPVNGVWLDAKLKDCKATTFQGVAVL